MYFKTFWEVFISSLPAPCSSAENQLAILSPILIILT